MSEQRTREFFSELKRTCADMFHLHATKRRWTGLCALFTDASGADTFLFSNVEERQVFVTIKGASMLMTEVEQFVLARVAARPDDVLDTVAIRATVDQNAVEVRLVFRKIPCLSPFSYPCTTTSAPSRTSRLEMS